MTARPSTVRLTALALSLVCGVCAQRPASAQTAPRTSVALPMPATSDVAVSFAAQVDVEGFICEATGPSWMQLSRDRTLELDAAHFRPGWITLRVLRRPGGRRGCAQASPMRVFVTGKPIRPVDDASVELLPENAMVEFRAPDLSGYSAVVVHDGAVRVVTPCLGRRTCTATLPNDLVEHWMRPDRRAQLWLWPTAVPLAPGGAAPALVGEEGAINPGQLKVTSIHHQLLKPLIQTTEIDGHAERAVVPLSFSEAVAAVNCKNARCALAPDGLTIYAIDRSKLSVRVRLELAPNISRLIHGRAVNKETFHLDVVRCAIRLPDDAPLLAGVEAHSYAIALSRDCLPESASELEIRTFPPTNAWVRGERASRDSGFRVFEVMFAQVPERIDNLELTLRRKGPTATTLAAVRVPIAQDFHPVGVRLDVGELGSADFVPRNRVATLHLAWVDPRWARDVRVMDRPGFYAVSDGGRRITGAPAATGSVPLRLAYAPASLKKLLRRSEPIAVFDTIARYPVRTLNVPLPITGRAATAAAPGRPALPALRPIARVVCKRGELDAEIPPARTATIAFDDRFGCRLVIDRSAIPPESGDQRLRVRAPGLNEVITVGSRPDAIELAIPIGNREEFDVLHISVAHEYTGAHYDFSPRQSLGAEAAWHVVLGDRQFRASVGTAMPTGLFRFGSDATRGAVAFSAGGLARIHWLYKEGREFPIGFDLGLLGTGLSNDPQLSLVTGLGFSVPVLNANTSLQASFNLHAWFEYSLTRVEGRTAFLFGPSFAIGKFSTNL